MSTISWQEALANIKFLKTKSILSRMVTELTETFLCLKALFLKAEVRSTAASALITPVFGNSIPAGSHHKGATAPQVGFELATNSPVLCHCQIGQDIIIIQIK